MQRATHVLVTILMVMIIVWTSEVKALENCGEEPTDMTITYGMSFSCIIESGGDSDIFHFTGSAGDQIIAEANWIEGGSIYFIPCVTLTSPTGSVVDEQCETSVHGLHTTFVQKLSLTYYTHNPLLAKAP